MVYRRASVSLEITGKAIELKIEITVDGFHLQVIKPEPKMCPVKIEKEIFPCLNDLMQVKYRLNENTHTDTT